MKNQPFYPIIGLEVHVELKTASKMFCGCDAHHFCVAPNIHTCPVCLGLPGALPVPNQKAIDWCLLAGLALNCQILQFSKFDRKNYFYPDLPKGYQISQYDLPFCQNGYLTVAHQKIRIRRVHLEEDTAKLIHQKIDGKNFTLVDFNRSGVPLMEIVTEPDIRSSQEAKSYLKTLQQLIRYLEVSDCDMEKGSMRCEVNISLSQNSPNSQLPDYKVEIKNINSFRFVEKALIYEIQRQKNLLESGQKIIQETRGWNETRQATVSQRFKEVAADYRYFPEPDIPPFRWTEDKIKQLQKNLPELPAMKIKRFVKKYQLTDQEATLLCQQKVTAAYFETAVQNQAVNPVVIAKMIINKKIDIAKIAPEEIVASLIKQKQSLIQDQDQLTLVVQKILKNHPQAVNDYQKGKKETLGFLIGQVMKATKSQADVQLVKKILIEKLKLCF